MVLFKGFLQFFFNFYQVGTCTADRGRAQTYFRVSYASLLSGCTNCDFGFLCLLLGETAVIFLDQLSRHHNLVSAAHAFQTEVCSDTHDFPLTAAARMRFFQFYDISYCVFIHSIFLFYLCLPFNDMRVRRYFTPLSAQIQSPVPAVSEGLLLRPSVWWTC